MNVVRSFDLSFNFRCQKSLFAPSLKITFAPASFPRVCPVVGMGWIKSSHIHTFPFEFRNYHGRWVPLSFTSCNPTTTITNQFFSDGSKFAVLGQTVRVCHKYINWLTGFLCPHVELCTFEDHVSLDHEMLIEFLFHFGIVRLVSLRESRTMTMSFASSAMQ